MWVHQCKESFSKGFLRVAGFSYNKKLKIRRMGKMLKSIQSTIKQGCYFVHFFVKSPGHRKKWTKMDKIGRNGQN